MNVLIATNAHRDVATSVRVGELLRAGLSRTLATARVRVIPVGDGGEGTIEALVHANDGLVVETAVHDPLFRRRPARVGFWESHEKLSVIEIASACGSGLLQPSERNTLLATSYGVGELIRYVVEAGCGTVIVGLGGCIASDGGMGMAQALGARFVDGGNSELAPASNGGFNALSLAAVAAIDLRQFASQVKDVRFIVAADVNTPLLGPTGQARTFGSQKGASEKEIEALERGLCNWHRVLRKTFGRDFDVPYAGAAGGLGAGLAAFLNAALCAGMDVFVKHTDFNQHLAWADVVVTGEGKFDATTGLGKAPQAIADLARAAGLPVLGVFGRIDPSAGQLLSVFDAVLEVPAEFASAGVPPLMQQEAFFERLVRCGTEIGTRLSSRMASS